MRKINSLNRVLLIAFDLLIIVFSLFAAWVIRSQFNFFVYDIRKFSYLFPWVIITRTLCHLFFELYSFSLNAFGSRDISRILKFNLLPTALLLFLRFFPKVPNTLSMPLSMIVMEYLFSTAGFIIIRLFFHSRSIKTDKVSGYIRRIILWAEVAELKEIIDLNMLEKNGIEVKGILNANPLFWNTEYNGIRIYGGAGELPRISAEDDRISSVAILKPFDLTKRQRKELYQQADKLNMEIGIIEENNYINKDKYWLNKED